MLTKDQIKAIRQAETVVLRNEINTFTGETVSRIELSKKVKNSVWKEEKQLLIDVESSIRNCNRNINAVSCIHSAEFDPVWSTIANMLKPNDIIILQWCYNGEGNNITKSLDLFADTLQIVIKRKDKKLTFNLLTSITYENSARMIKLA